MHVKSIAELEPTFCRAVIVNVSTKEVSTLALLSVLRHTQLRVMLLDLESTDESWEHFSRLAQNEPRLDLCQGALQKHGYVLDKLFHETFDETLLLVDSDLEICDAGIVNRMLEAVAVPGVFGAGAIHNQSWLDHRHGFPEKLALYRERMWIPFTILRVKSIRMALLAGYSFINHWVPNELTGIPWISKLLSRRFFVPGVKHLRADFLSSTRHPYGTLRPNLVCCDTGSDIFCYLRDEVGELFVDFGIDHIESLAHHYHGVTRRKLHRRDRNATEIDDILQEVIRRLDNVYNFRFPLTKSSQKR
jgi:hypothetical protein